MTFVTNKRKEDIIYTCNYNRNRLNSIEKKSFPSQQTTTMGFEYDLSGNLTERSDDAGNTMNISYNKLNLPNRYNLNGKTIDYIYDAAGNKITKIADDEATINKTHYVGNVVYQDDLSKPEFILTSFGRVITLEGGSYEYEYSLTDHLGNVRVRFRDQGGTADAIQANDYYPYGMLYSQTLRGSESKFMYTGKELQDDHNLNWYDFGSRYYDPVLAKWHAWDPANQFYGFSGYGYALNNPLIYTDPDGEFIWFIPSIGWSKKGGLSVGMSFVVGVPGGLSAQTGIGYSFGSNDAYGYVGATAAMNTVYASYSLNNGGSVGYTAGLSQFSGLPISTNFGTVGVNYNITHGSWSGNVSAWQVDQNGWTFNPSLSAMVFPEQTTNLVRSGKFIDNDAMLKTYTDIGDYQGALDYFGFKGKYDPDNELFKGGKDAGITHPETGEIYYNTTAFDGGFDELYFTADHEYWHHRRVVSGKYLNSGNTISKEEYLAWTRNYKRQGLYRNHEVDEMYDMINRYGTAAVINPDVIFNYCFDQPWWHRIYKIPRKW